MDIIKLSLFPTLVLYFPQFINSEKCDNIFKLLKTKKLDDHGTLIKGKSTYNFNINILSELSMDLRKPLQEYSFQSKIKIENKLETLGSIFKMKEVSLKNISIRALFYLEVFL